MPAQALTRRNTGWVPGIIDLGAIVVRINGAAACTYRRVR